jgi:hypothetical protein
VYAAAADVCDNIIYYARGWRSIKIIISCSDSINSAEVSLCLFFEKNKK